MDSAALYVCRGWRWQTTWVWSLTFPTSDNPELWLHEAEDLLGANERVSWSSDHPDDRWLVIAANKAKTEATIELINRFASKIEKRSVPLGAIVVAGHKPDPSELDELSRATKTAISCGSSSVGACCPVSGGMLGPDKLASQLEIEWFPDPSRTAPFESLGQVVERLLISAFRPETSFTRSLTVVPGSAVDGHFVREHDGPVKYSWRDQLSSWSRWIGPQSRPGPSHRLAAAAPDGETNIPSNVLPWPVTGSPESKEQQESEPREGRWFSDYTTTASFGHLVHKDASGLLNPRIPRLLSSRVPHPSALSALSMAPSTAGPSTSLLFHFIPPPSSSKAPRAPRLEFRMWLPPGSPESDLSWDLLPRRELRAVVRTHAADILFPRGPVDVRLAQRRVASQGSAHPHAPWDDWQPDLTRFIDESELNLAEGRLLTPPGLTISFGADFDGWLGPSSDDGAASPPRRRRRSPSEREVAYAFGGLEVHRSVEATLAGHALRYTSIEAGLGGGRRAELTLHGPVAGTGGGVDDQGCHAAAMEYLKLVQRVATGQVFPWWRPSIL